MWPPYPQHKQCIKHTVANSLIEKLNIFADKWLASNYISLIVYFNYFSELIKIKSKKKNMNINSETKRTTSTTEDPQQKLVY